MSNRRKIETEEKKPSKTVQKASKVMRPMLQFVSGNFLVKEDVMDRLPYILFLVFMGLVYIANGYMAQDTVRKISKTSSELKELRSEFITIQSDLMYTTKQSELVKILEERDLGLVESTDPPRKLVLTEEEEEKIEELLER